MKNDFTTPTPRSAPPAQLPPTEAPSNPPLAPQQSRAQGAPPIDELPVPLAEHPSPGKSKKPRRIFLGVTVALLLVVVASVMSAAAWYQLQLRPVDPRAEASQQFEIVAGALPDTIASNLKSAGLIRSELAFSIYTRLDGTRGQLQAGSYTLSPSLSLPEIVDTFVSGRTESFTITFYPGATLYDPTDIADENRTDVYTMLRRAGYSDKEVEAAFAADYDHPVFAGKPAEEGVEGYVYGETYQFSAGTTAREVLEHSFDTMYEAIKNQGIESAVSQQGLSLYEAVTLASVIEREVSNIPDDQRKVAQVFYTRLERGMPLGADATFKYVAQQRDVPARIDIESPYNTRINKGLPPGPIASPGINALKAVANPASTEFVYFVSGDDGKNYFSKTNAEHEEKTRRHCTELCRLP
jgi:UPF0755 protein